MSVSFTFVDLLVLVVVIASAWYAGYRGLVAETLSIFAWAAAAFATLWFGPKVGPLARNFVSSPLAAIVVAYAVVFLIVLVPLSFLSHRFSQQVKSSQVGTLDRTLGAAFGVVRGLAIIGFAYLILDSFVKFDSQPDAVRNARSLPLMQASTEVILSLVPSRHEALGEDAQPDAEAPPPARVSQEVSPQQDAQPPPKPKSETAAAKPAPARVVAKAAKKPVKPYSNRDRRALDSLIETTGGNSPP
ncbi:MAG TPA: CvpA family protein [Rhizomicrobium sp.]|jgi:membrane protein required for colicin V production